jgi:O-antigen/teichoic acid export membrane protein
MQVAQTRRPALTRPSRLVVGGLAVVAGTAMFQLANFLTNAVAARTLGPASYGDLAAVVGLVYLASPFFVSMQTVASRLTTRSIADGQGRRVRGLLAYYLARVVLVVGLAGAVFALGSGLVARAIRVPSALPIALLSVVFVLSAVTHLQRGVLQGAHRFGQFGASSAIEGWAKVFVAVALLRWVSASPASVIVAIAAAGCVGAFGNWWMLRSMPPSAYGVMPEAHPYRFSAQTLGTLLLLASLLSVDVIAANRYLSETAAGLYAALSLTAKTVFFATSAVTMFAFPVFSQRQDLGRDARPLLLSILAAVVAIVVCATVAFSAFPSAFLGALFGARFRAAASYVPWAAAAFGLYAVVHVCSMYLLSQGRSLGLGVLAACALLQLAGLRTFHDTIATFLAVQTVVFGVGAAALVVIALVVPRRASVAPEAS